MSKYEDQIGQSIEEDADNEADNSSEEPSSAFDTDTAAQDSEDSSGSDAVFSTDEDSSSSSGSDHNVQGGIEVVEQANAELADMVGPDASESSNDGDSEPSAGESEEYNGRYQEMLTFSV
jgi:hypothetical protein